MLTQPRERDLKASYRHTQIVGLVNLSPYGLDTKTHTSSVLHNGRGSVPGWPGVYLGLDGLLLLVVARLTLLHLEVAAENVRGQRGSRDSFSSESQY